MNPSECRLPKTHKEIVRIMVFSIPYLKDGQATSNTKARAPLPGFSRVIWDEWGKKGVRMDTKALKKQMGAAIAMVLVAAVALGSATFAWFVSNNTVKATTTNISAQSNSAYLVIDNANAGSTKTSSTGSATASETFTPDTKLYPAQWKRSFDATGGKAASEADGVWQFESAYAKDKTATDEKDGTRFAVGNPETAATKDYTLANTFYIGTGTYDGTFTNLKVTGVEVNNTSNSELDSAMRVLVTCGNEWAVWSKTGKESSSRDDGVIKVDGITKNQDATVKVYVYYDGADSKVYTTNLENIAKDCGVTVTFEATPTEFK